MNWTLVEWPGRRRPAHGEPPADDIPAMSRTAPHLQACRVRWLELECRSRHLGCGARWSGRYAGNYLENLWPESDSVTARLLGFNSRNGRCRPARFFPGSVLGDLGRNVGSSCRRPSYRAVREIICQQRGVVQRRMGESNRERARIDLFRAPAMY